MYKTSTYVDLVDAVIRGDLEAVKRIAKDRGYPMKAGHLTAEENTVIRFAAARGHLQVVKWLIQIDEGNKRRAQSAIEVAAECGHLHIVQALAADGSVDLKQAVYHGALHGQLPVVKWLIETYPEIKDMGKTSPFMCAAAKNGHVNIIEFFHSVLPDAKGSICEAFIAAAQGGHIDVMEWLASAGEDDDVKNVDTLSKALYVAALDGHLDAVKWLVGCGARTDDNCVLLSAVDNGHNDVVKFLLEQGADETAIKYHVRTSDLLHSIAKAGIFA